MSEWCASLLLSQPKSWDSMLASESYLQRAPVREGPYTKAPPTPEYANLQILKGKVPLAIARVGAKKWVSSLPAPGYILARGPICSRAYHKIGEIFASCALPFPKASLHLCEAPGGFVQWIGDNHVCRDEWQWTALSLPDGPIFRRDLLQMSCGEVRLCDVNEFDANGATYDLVTADGAADMDHANIEEEHYPLLLSQTRTALSSLKPGGTFVLKFFEGGSALTLSLIACCTHAFSSTSVIKPHTSRATNSERYLVCRGFVPDSVLPNALPVCVADGWMREAAEVMDSFHRNQARELRKVLTNVLGRDAMRGE